MVGGIVIAAATLWVLIRMFKAWYYHDVKNEEDGEWNNVGQTLSQMRRNRYQR